MTRILQRYLASSFVLPFIFSCLFFVAFLLTFQLFRIVRIVINKGIPFSEVLALIGHIGISFLPIALPLSALFATIFALNRLSEDSEIVAIRSFGVSKYKLFTPFLVMAILVGIVLFSLNRNLIPYSKKMFKNTIIKMTSKGVLTNIQPGQFFIDVPDVTLFAEEVRSDGRDLSKVFIHMNKGRGGEQIIVARKGIIINQKEVGDISPSIRMHLEDGNITKVTSGQGDLQKILFKEYDFPLLSQNYRPGFVTKDSMRSNSELRKVMRKEVADFDKLQVVMKQRKLSNKEKEKYDEILGSLPKTKLEYYTRINNPLLCLIFILLGFSLGIKKGRGRSGNTSLTALLFLVLYYTLFFAGVSAARKNKIPAEMVVFIPTLLVATGAGYYFKKLDWQS